MFRDMMDFSLGEEDTEEYVNELKAHFAPQPGFSANYKISIEGKKKPLIIEVNTKQLECYYGNPSVTFDVEMQLQKKVMDEITNGRMTFQRAFMGGDMKMKGDFRILRSLDQIFNFIN
jgi:putative sterol carrier protein